MSVWYVRSGATGTAAGTSWANATTTLAAAITLGAAGDTYYVSEDHAETQATALTITFKGTITSSDKCYCVNHAGSVPPVAADITTGGSISTTGASAMTIAGDVYVNGLTLNCGTGANAVALTLNPQARQVWENCSLKRLATTTSPFAFGSSNNAQSVTLKNTSLSAGNTADSVKVTGCVLKWQNSTGFTGATLPTVILENNTGFHLGGMAEIDGVDFSGLASGATLMGNGSTTAVAAFKNCKLPASYAMGSTLSAGTRIDVIDSDSGSASYKNARATLEANLTTETTIIRTAGASDGTTPFSWKIITTAKNGRTMPFETFEGAIWNATTGSSKTLTFHCVTDNVTLQDADIWVEVEYLGASTSPVASLVSSAPATQLTAGANLTTDTEAWTTTGLTTPVKQKFSVTFTPQMVGAIRWKVKVAKASATVYIDPNPDLA